MALHSNRLLIFAITALFAVPLTARSQEPATAPAARPLPIITREDLATAYVRVERALHENQPEGRHRAAAHREMDRAVYQFFTGDHSAAIRTMNDLSDWLHRGGAIGEQDAPGLVRPDWKSFMRSMRVRVAPRVANIHRPSIFNVRISRLYASQFPEPLDLRLVVREDKADGKIVFEQAIQIRSDGALPSISAKQPDAQPGAYRVQLIGPDDEVIDVGRWYVVDQSLDALRTANERRLGTIPMSDFNIFQALVACRARNALLSDRINEGESSQFLINPVELSRQVQAEVEALQQGTNPYAGRIGDYWSAIPAGAMQIPSRIYAPQQANEDQPLPLVIVLHGAGADENAFMEANGAGEIKRLADRHGFIVVSPSSYWVLPNPSALNGIIQTMSVNYAIDRSRVYVIGHSLGAGAAVGMATRRPDAVAAAVLIAGGRFPPKTKTCPTLLMAAEMDSIFPPHQLERVAVEAKEQGAPVEFRLVRDAGHTLVIGEVLPEAVEWLLTHRAEQQRK